MIAHHPGPCLSGFVLRLEDLLNFITYVRLLLELIPTQKKLLSISLDAGAGGMILDVAEFCYERRQDHA